MSSDPKVLDNIAQGFGPPKKAPFRWLFVLVCLATLIALFYAEENWRGKAAWEAVKRELEAQGHVLDWAAYTPEPVPDSQNIFKAPKMEEWFGRRIGNGGGFGSSPLLQRLKPQTLSEFLLQRGTNGGLVAVAEVTVVPLAADLSTSNADVVLRFNYPDWASLGAFSPDQAAAPDTIQSAGSTNASHEANVIPVIVLDEVPILQAITNLAQQAGVKYKIDPNVDFGEYGPHGERRPQPTISVRWENITAQRALLAVLNNYNLELIDDAKSRIGRIIRKETAGRSADLGLAARNELRRAVQNAQAPGPAAAGRAATGSQGYTFVVTEPASEPARVFVRADRAPDAKEIAELFRGSAPSPDSVASNVRIEATSSNSFRVWGKAPWLLAADYLAWTDEFETEFDVIREALKRPRARLDGDYEHPYARPIPNFVAARVVAQTLAQRAQCHLLLNEPEAAWRDLALVRDSCRIMEAKPSTIVAAMIEVAITGLYVDALADGLRLHVWREAQLTAIQEQLKQVDLLPQLIEGLEFQRASSCRTLISGEFGPATFRYADRDDVSLWQKLKDPMFLVPKVAPRGWLQQNAAAVARLEQKAIDAADLTNRLMAPHKIDAMSGEFEATFARFSPYTIIARTAAANFFKAFEVLARCQTMANEAQIVCALERHRQAEGQLPETLDALAPRFIEKLPLDIVNGQPLKYRRTGNDQFLLYSVGWNETDDGGALVPAKGGVVQQSGKDWVWR